MYISVNDIAVVGMVAYTLNAYERNFPPLPWTRIGGISTWVFLGVLSLRLVDLYLWNWSGHSYSIMPCIDDGEGGCELTAYEFWQLAGIFFYCTTISLWFEKLRLKKAALRQYTKGDDVYGIGSNDSRNYKMIYQPPTTEQVIDRLSGTDISGEQPGGSEF